MPCRKRQPPRSDFGRLGRGKFPYQRKLERLDEANQRRSSPLRSALGNKKRANLAICAGGLFAPSRGGSVGSGVRIQRGRRPSVPPRVGVRRASRGLQEHDWNVEGSTASSGGSAPGLTRALIALGRMQLWWHARARAMPLALPRPHTVTALPKHWVHADRSLQNP
jgi:hypothetical protein